MGFTKKKNFTIDKRGKKFITNGTFSQKGLFRPIYEVFRQGNRKFLKLEKLENEIKKVRFEKKKVFHLLESLFYKNGKAENMSVVAGRLVTILIYISIQMTFCFIQENVSIKNLKGLYNSMWEETQNST